MACCALKMGNMNNFYNTNYKIRCFYDEREQLAGRPGYQRNIPAGLVAMWGTLELLESLHSTSSEPSFAIGYVIGTFARLENGSYRKHDCEILLR